MNPISHAVASFKQSIGAPRFVTECARALAHLQEVFGDDLDFDGEASVA
jgi:hypothetical protein